MTTCLNRIEFRILNIKYIWPLVSTGLVVTGGDSIPNGVRSNPSSVYWTGWTFVEKIVIFVWKDENKLKRGRVCLLQSIRYLLWVRWWDRECSCKERPRWWLCRTLPRQPLKYVIVLKFRSLWHSWSTTEMYGSNPHPTSFEIICLGTFGQWRKWLLGRSLH